MVEELKFCVRCGVPLGMESVEDHPRPVCPACRLVVFLDPKLVVAGLVEQSGRLLFVRRNREPGIGKWALPGGFVERGEVVEEALQREILEETGLQVTVQGLVGLYSQPGDTIVLVAYAVAPAGGTLNGASPEVQEVAFFPIQQPPPLAFPRDLRLIHDWLRWRQRGR